MTVKPISPQHGTERCYRNGCRREICRSAYRNSRKRADYHRRNGHHGNVDTTAVALHLSKLLDSGLTRLQIASAADVSDRAIRYVLNGQTTMHRSTAIRILGVQPRTEPVRVDATATRRRIQALAYIGWPIIRTAEAAGLSHRHVFGILNGSVASLAPAHAQRYERVYAELSERPGPTDHSRSIARRNGWAPPIAWDDDTIVDPAAHPEWTGQCGTDRGYHLHKIEHIPMCTPCDEAHQQWLAERPDLKGVELRSAIASARGQAAGRGVALAENARELLAQELSWDAIVIRLAADPGQIAAAMRKYPNARQPAAA